MTKVSKDPSPDVPPRLLPLAPSVAEAILLGHGNCRSNRRLSFGHHDDRAPGAGAGGGSRREQHNILVMFDDDVGVANISAYSNGLMGSKRQSR